MMLPMKRRQEYGGHDYQKRRREVKPEPSHVGRQSGGDPRTWNSQQVHDWILEVQTKSGEVFATEFLENDINGGDMLDLEQPDFFEQFAHVTNAFAKKKLWRNIQSLKSTSQKFPTPPGRSKPPPPKPPVKPYSYEEQMGRRQQEEHLVLPPRQQKPFGERERPRGPPPRGSSFREGHHGHREEGHHGHREERHPSENYGHREERYPSEHHPPYGPPPGEQHYPAEQPPPVQNAVTTGCVKSYLRDRNFGFIAETDTLRDVYFHGTQFSDGKAENVKDGDLLQFTIVKTAKGWEAHHITPIKSAVPKARVAGFITKYPPEGKYGDIFDNAGYTIFFFAKDFAGTPCVGDYVSFEVMSTLRRPRALRIKKMNDTRGYVQSLNRTGGIINEDNNLRVQFSMDEVKDGEELREGAYVQFEVTRDHYEGTARARNITCKVDPKYRPKPKNFAGTSRGIVTDFYPEKFYGFVKDLTNGETIFVHSDQIVGEDKTLMQDDFVQFDVGIVKKGFKAFNCTKMQLPKPRGKITFFNEDRGFGYVRERQGVDLFFHIRSCEGRPKEPDVGDYVEFDIEGGQKGPMAVNVIWVEPDQGLDQDQALSQGEVKELRPDHGFILQDVGGPDAYFLPMDTDPELSPEVGSRVEYAILPTGKGPKAFNIKVIQGGSAWKKSALKNGPSHGMFKCFYPAKQIGFVKDHTGVDIFFRRSDWAGEDFDHGLLQGSQVKYVVTCDSRGPAAKKITRAEEADISEVKEVSDFDKFGIESSTLC